MLRTTIKAIAVFVLSALVVPAAVGATVLGVFLFMPLPATLPEKKALNESRPSTILDINGQPIGQFRKFDTNIPFTKDDVPDVLGAPRCQRWTPFIPPCTSGSKVGRPCARAHEASDSFRPSGPRP